MIYYINILLLCIALFLLFKTFNRKEGIDNIPNVPHDVVCMILHGMGIEVELMGYLHNKCATTPDKKPDNSNICRA